ncbi:MAG: pyridoxal phosphate-dependent aminotransferase, partial [Gammaproteobacteria bacterium]|nr:pyridoxal phosphate-dependent aminotransferase [Gammaproteobacteria bacterium]
MPIQISDRLNTIKTSPTMAVTAKADELKAAGHDVIGLGAGEPDFDTPLHIREAAKAAMDNGLTRYTAVDGTPELKDAIIGKFARDNQLQYDRSQIVVSCGGKHAIYNLIHSIINPGDEAIIPAPFWVSYTDIVLLAGGNPIVVNADIDSDFKITPAQLEAALTPKTRLLMLNSPSNPTGVCYRKAELQALGEVLKGYPQVVIATDDIYEHIVWGDEPFCNIVNACPDLYDRTVVINGVSKAYAMTGWRIGFAASPPEIAAAMRKIQSQCTSNPSSISQAASVVALRDDQSFLADMVKVFKKRHDYVYKRLNDMKGVRSLEAQGAFYAFP